jgi:hypothetical protein
MRLSTTLTAENFHDIEKRGIEGETVKFAHSAWTSRGVWLGPLISAFLIVTAMFVVAGRPIDVPFIYRQAK